MIRNDSTREIKKQQQPILVSSFWYVAVSFLLEKRKEFYCQVDVNLLYDDGSCQERMSYLILSCSCAIEDIWMRSWRD